MDRHGTSPSSIAMTVFFAVIGYISTALHTLRAQQHRGRVERVNQQLRELYGPLLACVTASKASYDAMLSQAKRDGIEPEKFRQRMRANPSGPAAAAYREWVKAVLMPLSEQAARRVIDRADLLEGSGMEPHLMQLVAHVSAYKVVMARWAEGSTTDFSAMPYPDGILDWINESYAMLKQRQADLLGISADGKQGSPLMQVIASRL